MINLRHLANNNTNIRGKKTSSHKIKTMSSKSIRKRHHQLLIRLTLFIKKKNSIIPNQTTIMTSLNKNPIKRVQRIGKKI